MTREWQRPLGARRLDAIRRSTGWSWAWIAYRVGVKTSALSRWVTKDRSKHRLPDPVHRQRIETAFPHVQASTWGKAHPKTPRKTPRTG